MGRHWWVEASLLFYARARHSINNKDDKAKWRVARNSASSDGLQKLSREFVHPVSNGQRLLP
jgi:hypothetical protein